MSTKFHNGYALLIGVGTDLPVTVKDAVALKELLVDQERAAYLHEHVELLVESKANRTGILAAFDQLIQFAEAHPNATILVYFSGHGGRIEVSGESPTYFLVPYGYDPGRRSETAISGLEFTNKIESIKSKKLVVLLDCCHAGGIPALKNSDEQFVKSPIPPGLLDMLDTGSGRVVIASSLENELSYTGTPYSIFTACLIEALSGKASVNKDGYARILDVLVYLYKYVPERSNEQQHPFVKKVLDLGDNFPICYYNGGLKSTPYEGSTQLTSTNTSNLSRGQRSRLQRKLETLQRPQELLSEKITRIRTALAIEAGEAIKFQLEKQLLQAETELANLDSEIDEIEQAIHQSG